MGDSVSFDPEDYDPTTGSGLINLGGGISSAGATAILDALGGPTLDEGLTGLDDSLQQGWKDLSGQTAADAAKKAAATQAQAQQNALEYLMQTEAMPQAFREGALSQLGAYYGIGLDPILDEAGNPTGQYNYTSIEATRPTQEQQLAQAKDSALYQSILGGREAGEEALARRATAAGGGLRGGATTSSLINYGTALQNEALLQSFNQQQQQEQQRLSGLGSLAMLPSQSSNIANMTAGIGQTQAMGITGAAQAQQQAIGNLLGLGGMLGAAAVSDERLKDDITQIGKTEHPYIDRYEWKWGEKAKEMGKTGKERGFIAQEVEQVWPDLVVTGEDGYKRINKAAIEMRLKEI